MKSRRKRALATVICSGLFLLVFGWVFSGTQIATWQARTLHWNYVGHALLFLVPLALIAAEPIRVQHYALKRTVGYGVVRCSLLLALPLLVAPIVGHLITSPLVLSDVAARYPVSTLIYQLLFVAVGEEFFFRGFFQGELNRAYGKPFRFGSTRFGVGVLAVTLLFGVGHLSNPFNPFEGRYELDWFGLFSSGSFAFVAGLLRERFNHLLPGVAMHAAWMTYLSGFKPNSSGVIAFYIAVGLAFGIGFHFLGEKDPAKTNSD